MRSLQIVFNGRRGPKVPRGGPLNGVSDGELVGSKGRLVMEEAGGALHRSDHWLVMGAPKIGVRR